VHLKGRDNILKRLLVHAGGFNLALIMRKLIGVGKPQRLQGALACIFACLSLLFLDAWSVLRTGGRINIAKREIAVTF
jgi:transposase